MSLTPNAYDPRFMKPATLCRCGHILECCADCNAWLVEHSPRIAAGWAYYIARMVQGRGGFVWIPSGQAAADAAEADDRAYYGLK